MRKMFFTAIMVLGLTLTVAAQDKNIDGAKAVTTYMKDQLLLNDSQYTKVYNVNLSFLQKVEENSKKNKGADRIKKLRALEDERDTKLKSVLSEDQYKNYVGNKAVNRKKIAEYYTN